MFLRRFFWFLCTFGVNQEQKKSILYTTSWVSTNCRILCFKSSVKFFNNFVIFHSNFDFLKITALSNKFLLHQWDWIIKFLKQLCPWESVDLYNTWYVICLYFLVSSCEENEYSVSKAIFNIFIFGNNFQEESVFF